MRTPRCNSPADGRRPSPICAWYRSPKPRKGARVKRRSGPRAPVAPLALMVALVAVGCHHVAPMATPSGDPAFDSLVDEAVAQYYAFAPSKGTQAGLHA